MFNVFSKKKQLPHVVFIHGANATSRSFNYIRNFCNITDYSNLNYNSADGFAHNLAAMREDLKSKENFHIIAHSLGGIYATYIQNEFKVKSVVSISTPFRGSRTADWAKMFVPMYKLFHDVGPKSKPVLDALDIDIKVPWLQIVSTSGHVPWHFSDNDGVVTLKSMTHRRDMDIEYVDYNHYEVLIADEVAKLIKDRLDCD